MITWGYATGAEVDALYQCRPHETLRAVVIKLDGVPAGIIGLAREPDRERMFSEYLLELKPLLRSMAVLRAIKAVMRWVESSRVPVYAISEGTGVLERLGFQHVTGEVFEWRG
jgi:hypothetical protein